MGDNEETLVGVKLHSRFPAKSFLFRMLEMLPPLVLFIFWLVKTTVLVNLKKISSKDIKGCSKMFVIAPWKADFGTI